MNDEQGRRRWGGVYLGNSRRDRTIAAWLDQVTDDPDVNVSELVKDHLYRLATGQERADETAAAVDKLAAEMGKLMRALASGSTRLVVDEEAGGDMTQADADEITRRLLIDD